MIIHLVCLQDSWVCSMALETYHNLLLQPKCSAPWISHLHTADIGFFTGSQGVSHKIFCKHLGGGLRNSRNSNWSPNCRDQFCWRKWTLWHHTQDPFNPQILPSPCSMPKMSRNLPTKNWQSHTSFPLNHHLSQMTSTYFW